MLQLRRRELRIQVSGDGAWIGRQPRDGGRMAEAAVVAAFRGSSFDKLSTRVTRMQRAASTSRHMCGRSKADAKLLLLPAEECTSQQRIGKSARGTFV